VNTVNSFYYDDSDVDQSTNEHQRNQPVRRRRRAPERARKPAASAFNGKHRRRNKRYSF